MTTLRRLIIVVGAIALVATACGGDDDQAASDEGDETPSATVLAVQADIVQGPANVPGEERGSKVCVLQSRYPRNAEVVWRTRVVDPDTGEDLDDEALESVVVELGDGQSFDMRYGPHPREDPTDFFWTTSWEVPEDYPTGTLDYQVMATASDGRTGTFKPFDVSSSLLTVTDEVLETIEEEEA